jgi:hypothetical protein
MEVRGMKNMGKPLPHSVWKLNTSMVFIGKVPSCNNHAMGAQVMFIYLSFKDKLCKQVQSLNTPYTVNLIQKQTDRSLSSGFTASIQPTTSVGLDDLSLSVNSGKQQGKRVKGRSRYDVYVHMLFYTRLLDYGSLAPA